MHLDLTDYLCFFGFLAVVIGISVWASGKEKTTEDYFLAGRTLTWGLIGVSLVASNISTEHFVGMAGNGFRDGLAVARYEWMAAITLVLVGVVFLPRFLKSGIFTIPQFLEYRYGPRARMVMAVMMLLAYNIVAMASVLYSGALTMKTLFGLNLYAGIWIIGILAAFYSVWGGLKSVVWTDLIQGIGLLLGGLLVTVLALEKVGGLQAFMQANADKLHTVKPADDPEMPWPAVFIWGLWIPNIFYWGLNQFITQRALGAKDIRQAQKGVMLAATIKLFIPFIIVFPGIISWQLYAESVSNPDQAYPTLIQNLVPPGLRGLILAALLGAVVSTLDSILNSASTLFTLDIWQKWKGNSQSQDSLIRTGRIATVIFTVFACLWAPFIAGFDGVFNYIQKIWGFISPGIFTVFVWGLLLRHLPAVAGEVTMLAGIVVYGLLLALLPDVAFLHHMGITFAILTVLLLGMKFILPSDEDKKLPEPVIHSDIRTSNGILLWGAGIVLATVGLYVYFA